MEKLRIQQVQTIYCREWDTFVKEAYQRPYNLQQQDGGLERQLVYLTIPSKDDNDAMNDSIPEIVNGEEMGVKFEVWLSKDPKQPFFEDKNDFYLEMFWERNFYPHLQTVANDLHKKGLIEAGDYAINIDW